MINHIITSIITNIFDSFDISFCIVANVATYTIVKLILDTKYCKYVGTWCKRLIFLTTSIIIAVCYIRTGSDYKTVLNSFILAPVSWSWIFKPLCAKLKIDYDKEVKDK